MLCFSYHFFVNSFIRRNLLKYTSSFLFHILHRFNFNILQVLQNSLKHVQNKLSICISYGLSVRYLCIQYTFNFIYFFLYTLFNSACLFELFKLNLLWSFMWNNISKFILYICSYSISLADFYYIYRYLKLITLLHKRYIKYNCTFIYPITTNVITLLRSPHIDKKARDQFAHISYKSTIRISKLPMHFPVATNTYFQHASNYSFKLISMVHYIYT